MALAFSNVGILARKGDPRVQQTLTPLINLLVDSGAHICVDDTLGISTVGVTQCCKADIGLHCDLVIVVGGDGTLLDACRTVADYGTPLLGVNLGRLGFLVDVSPDNICGAINNVLTGHYIKKPRLRLAARIIRADGSDDNEIHHALNECVIRNQEFARVLDFDTYTQADFISHHRADGIVVATPTGSTAYALSGGGPVVHPEIAALSLVPICPHTLSDRPLIVDANKQIEVRISAAHNATALFTADGQVTRPLASGDRVIIERADSDLILIHPPDYDYFHILRTKLEWGHSLSTTHPARGRHAD